MKPRAADGRKVIDKLKGSPRYREIIAQYRKAAVAQSCAADLRQARDMAKALDQLLKSTRKAGSDTRAATETALLASAVQLYARATHTAASKGGRGSIDIRSRLATEQQRTDHKKLTAARVRGIAHVYPGELVEGVLWHREEMLFVEQGLGWKLAFASNRVQLDRETFNALKRQLPAAQAIVLKIFHERNAALTDAINASAITSAMIEAELIDLEEMFGANGAETVIEGQGEGYAVRWD